MDRNEKLKVIQGLNEEKLTKNLIVKEINHQLRRKKSTNSIILVNILEFFFL